METKTQRNTRLKAQRKKYHLGEFRNSRSRARSGASHSRRSESMAKKRSRSRSRSGGLMNAPLKLGREIDEGIKGVGGGLLMNMIPVNIPYKNVIGGYLTGGVYGALGSFLVFGSGSTGSTTGTSGASW